MPLLPSTPPDVPFVRVARNQTAKGAGPTHRMTILCNQCGAITPEFRLCTKCGKNPRQAYPHGYHPTPSPPTKPLREYVR